MTESILRWVGSKRGIAKPLALELWNYWSVLGGRYFEPFLGSASVALALRDLGANPKYMILSDGLNSLIETWKALTTYPKQTIEAFQELSEKAERAQKRALFNRLREELNADRRSLSFAQTPRPELAAKFIYLNARGFNGLVRQNKEGDFNMSMGRSGYKKKELRLPKPGDLLDVSRALQGATLLCSDFEAQIDQAEENDLIYADPPYDGTFSGYSQEWKESDQERLAMALFRAFHRGAYIFSHNTDTPRIRTLYGDWATIQTKEVRFMVGDKKSRDKAVSEGWIRAMLVPPNKGAVPNDSKNDMHRG